MFALASRHQPVLYQSVAHMSNIESRQHTGQVFDLLQGLEMARTENARDAVRRLRIEVNAVGAYIHRCQPGHGMPTVLLQIGVIKYINIGRHTIGDHQQDLFHRRLLRQPRSGIANRRAQPGRVTPLNSRQPVPNIGK